MYLEETQHPVKEISVSAESSGLNIVIIAYRKALA